MQTTLRHHSHARRLSLAILISLLALLVATVPTLAGVTWCRADPIVKLNNEVVQIWVAVPQEYAAKVTGPIDVTIMVPGSVSKDVLLLDAGFNGYGERVSFVSSGAVLPGGSFYMTVVAKVPMKGTWQSVPVQMEIIHDNQTSRFFYGSQYVATATMLIDAEG
jgi:hypothetical protein